VPYIDCDSWTGNGCEIKADTDPSHCGACKIQCATSLHNSTTSCDSGHCKPICDPGWLPCDHPESGCLIDTQNDPNNCGACGTVCKGGNCTKGVCDCPDIQPARDIDCSGSWTCGPYMSSEAGLCLCFCVNALTRCRVGFLDGPPC
jgi:hypothetical protein